jgi:hypothetical protein
MIRLGSLMAGISLAMSMFAPFVRADEWNKYTIITANQPIQIPGRVLPPGKYVLKLLHPSASNRSFVGVYSGTGQHLITTVLARPNYRKEPSGRTVLTFWETPAGTPQVLRAWFWPGDYWGEEFVYPESLAAQLAKTSHQQVPTLEAQKLP